MTKFRTLPALLDRFEKALSAQGIKLKRSQLLEVSAAAFGWHNSNEMTAAFKQNEIIPPASSPIGTIKVADEELILLMDPLANAPYGIDLSFLEQVIAEERAEKIGITPYGNLVNLNSILDAPLPSLILANSDKNSHRTLHVAVVNHRHGQDVHVGYTREACEASVADYARDWWDEARNRNESLDPDCSRLEDKEVIDSYFSAMSDGFGNNEYVDWHEETLKEDLASKAQNNNDASYVIGMVSEDIDDDPILFWSNKNGYGSLSEATVFPDTSYNLPTTGIDPENVKWYKLPSFNPSADAVSCSTKTETDEIWKKFRDFAKKHEPLIDQLQAELQGRDLDDFLDDRISDLKGFLGAKAANLAGNNENLQEAAIATVESWVAENVHGNRALEIACVLYLEGMLGGIAQLQACEPLGAIANPSMDPCPEMLLIDMYNLKLFEPFKPHVKKVTPQGICVYWDMPQKQSVKIQAEVLKAKALLNSINVSPLSVKYDVSWEEKEGFVRITAFLPSQKELMSPLPACWLEAIDDLFTPREKRYKAMFTPQAWFRDQAIEVDSEGDTIFDVTFEVLAAGLEENYEKYAHNLVPDDLKDAIRAPQWIRSWHGPFNVHSLDINVADD